MKKPKKKKSRKATAPKGYSAPALEKGIDIVELLARVPAGLTISEIAERLRRSMNEVFRIIVVMEGRGWLHKNSESDRYTVTYHLLELVQCATPARSLSAIAAPVMYELAVATNQSCHLVVRAGGRALIIQREESGGMQGGFAVQPGTAIDLVKSCSGHVLLAFAAPHMYKAILAQLPRPLPWPIRKLERRLAQVRRRGYELQPSYRTHGVTDVSFPIFGFDGHIAAALTVPYLLLIDKSAPTTLNQTRDLLEVAARKVSLGLGWAGERA